MKPLLICFLTLMFPFVSILAQTQEELLEKLETAEQIDKAHIYNELARINLGRNPDVADEYAHIAGLLATEYNLKNELGLSYKYRGIVAYFKSNDVIATSFYEQALAIFRETQNLLEISNIYNNMANIYFNRQEFQQALELHKQALSVREEFNNSRLIIASLINIGNIHSTLNQLALADSVYRRALDINRLVLPDEVNPILLLSLGRVLISIGNYDEAKEMYAEAYINAEKQGNIRDIFTVNNNVGNFYLGRGDYILALEYYNRAFEAAKSMNLKLQMASILLNIGNTFDFTGQPERALDFYLQSYPLFLASNEVSGIASILVNIGAMYDRLNQPDSSLVYFQKSVDYIRDKNYPDLLAMSLSFLGNQYRIMGNVEDAKLILTEAFTLAESISAHDKLAKITYNLASLYVSIGNFETALTYATRSVELNRAFGRMKDYSDALIILSSTLEGLNRHAEALTTFKEYTAIQDSLTNASRRDQIIAIQEQLNLALKERELENKTLEVERQQLLVSQARERFAYLFAIFALMIVILVGWVNWTGLRRSREKLLMEQRYIETEHRLLRSQMNPHFLFNALNSIQLFISEKDSKQAEMYLSKFAHLMRYYLDSSFTSNVLLKEEVDGLRLNMELEQLRMNNSFSYQIELSEDLEPEMTEIPPMLAQPFVENAVKHGLRTVEQNGFLRVRFESTTNNSIRCIIEDNGIGREAASRLKRTGNGHASRGIDITTSRLKNIWKDDYTDDYLSITDLTDAQGNPSGTRVEILFPTN